MSFLLGVGIFILQNTKSCGNILSILPQPFSCNAKLPLCLISRSKAVDSISVGLLTCISSADSVCLLRKSQWLAFANDRIARYLQRRVRGDFHPILLFSRTVDLRCRPATEIFIQLKNKKRLWMRSKTKEHHHNHSKAIFWRGTSTVGSLFSRSPDSHLRRIQLLPSQVSPMTGFRQRNCFSMYTVLVNAGLWMKPYPIPLLSNIPDKCRCSILPLLVFILI